MGRCTQRQSLARAYTAAAAELNRTVGEMGVHGAVDTAGFQSARGEFARAKRTADAARDALEAHEREHHCSTYS